MTTATKKKSSKHKMHPNSLANLKPIPWKPGESGNPDGLSITARARMAINRDDICPYDSKGRPWGEALKDSLLRQALTKVDGMRELLDRIEGPVNKAGPVRDINVVFVIGKGYSELPSIAQQSTGG